MAGQFDIFDRVGRELKLSQGSIIGLRNTLDAIASMASWVTAGVTALNTVKDILDMLGDVRSTEDILADIETRQNMVIKRLGDDARSRKLQRRSDWKAALERAQTAFNDLRTSRSHAAFDEAKQALTALAGALNVMLDYGEEVFGGETRTPHAGVVPFVREQYGAPPWQPVETIRSLPEHWVYYASEMRTIGGRQAPITDLQDELWDPGYYLDLATSGTRLFVALLTVMEPAYRSTAVRRTDLARLIDKLRVFLYCWESSLLVTDVDNLVRDNDGNMTATKGGLYHPYRPLVATSAIPLGVVDVATGVSMLDVRYIPPNANIVLGSPSTLDPLSTPISNPEDVHSKVSADLQAMVTEMKRYCGIANMRSMLDEMDELARPASDSLYCRVKEFSSASAGLWYWPEKEMIKLPDAIGLGGGKTGVQYGAQRISQTVDKRFRVPMARRMDYSLIQLGYRMQIRIKKYSETASELNIVLCDIDTWETPIVATNPEDVFPEGHAEHSMNVAGAEVFDVVQSAPFDAKEERAVESGEEVTGKERVLINRRAGAAAIQVVVDTHIDLNDPKSPLPFVGYADVLIRLVNPDAKDGFIAEVELFETGNASEESLDLVEYRADGFTLHIVPTFLLADQAYFDDLHAGDRGLREMMTDKVPKLENKDLVLPDPEPEPDNPFDPVKLADHREQLIARFERFQKKHPEVAKKLLAERLPSIIVRHKS